MTHPTIKHVGLDDHKDSICVAVADADGDEVRSYGRIDHTPEQVSKLLTKLAVGGHTLVCWYEAGACGYGLHRQIVAAGHRCHVVAPSLTPRRAGDRMIVDGTVQSSRTRRSSSVCRCCSEMSRDARQLRRNGPLERCRRAVRLYEQGWTRQRIADTGRELPHVL